jgi:hypothetical protein
MMALPLSTFRWPTCLKVGQWLVGLVAMVMLLGALITPWGLARSHGTAALSDLPDLHQSQTLGSGNGHGHSHEGDSPASPLSHAHHAGDHSHDNAHDVPVALPRLSEHATVWRQRSSSAGPWPSLDGLERPPRS